MKKTMLTLVLAITLLFSFTAQNNNTYAAEAVIDKNATLKVYSWEDYIAVDEESGLDMATEFQNWYNEKNNANIKVEYSTFGTNENMYNELKINKGNYDLVCPSDYMIQKMINEGMAKPFSAEFLDATNPNSIYAKNVSGYIDNLFAKNKVGANESWRNYAAGYMWGTMGLVYNPQTVEKVDMESWSALWNNMYKNKTTIKDSVRDSFFLGLAFVYRTQLRELSSQYETNKIRLEAGLMTEAEFKTFSDGYQAKLDVLFNDTSAETLAKVEIALKTVKENLFSFEVDSGKNDMITGKIDINFAWSGDAAFSIAEAEDAGVKLYYSVPKEGSNVWFDGWVMPKDTQNQALAETFINYLSKPANAWKNSEYIGYTSAIGGDEMFDNVSEKYAPKKDETTTYDVDLSYFFTNLTGDRNGVVTTGEIGRRFSAQYPDYDTIMRCSVMQYFDDATNTAVNDMWERVKGTTFPIWIIFGIIGVVAVGVGAFIVIKVIKKKSKKGYTVVKKG